MDNEEHKLYSLSKAARTLGIGTRALRLLIATGRIAVLRIGKRQKVSFKDINKFLESSMKETIQLTQDEETPRKLKVTLDLNTILETLIKEKKNGIHLQA